MVEKLTLTHRDFLDNIRQVLGTSNLISLIHMNYLGPSEISSQLATNLPRPTGSREGKDFLDKIFAYPLLQYPKTNRSTGDNLLPEKYKLLPQAVNRVKFHHGHQQHIRLMFRIIALEPGFRPIALQRIFPFRALRILQHSA